MANMLLPIYGKLVCLSRLFSLV